MTQLAVGTVELVKPLNVDIAAGMCRLASGSTRLQLCLEQCSIQSFEWTNVKVFEYRDFPVLWDCRMKEYKGRNQKLDALIVIAVSFGVDKSEVDRKIKNLVCHFLREVKMNRDSINSGARNEDV